MEEPFKPSDKASSEDFTKVAYAFFAYTVIFNLSVMDVCSFTLAYDTLPVVFTYSSLMQQEADSSSKKHGYSSQEDLRHITGRKSHKQDVCVKLHHLGCQFCFSRKSRDASFLKNTYLHRLIGEHEAKIVLTPGKTLNILGLSVLFEAV